MVATSVDACPFGRIPALVRADPSHKRSPARHAAVRGFSIRIHPRISAAGFATGFVTGQLPAAELAEAAEAEPAVRFIHTS